MAAADMLISLARQVRPRTVATLRRDLAELNETVFRQQQIIERLQAQLKLVTDQLKGIGIELDPTPHQKPPHY